MGGNLSITRETKEEDITAQLQVRQTIISTLVWAHFLGVLYLICQTLVVGYAVVTTPAGTTAVPHTIWLLAPMLVNMTVAFTTRFEVGLFLDTLSAGIYYAYAILVIAIATNAVAVGLFGWEMAQGVSNFYVESYGFLIATIIVTALFIVVEIALIGAIYMFHRDLLKARDPEINWQPFYQDKSPFYTVQRDDTNDLIPETQTASNISYGYTTAKRGGLLKKPNVNIRYK